MPVVAVVGENSGTELTDFVIPYGVLARSGAVQLLSVATKAGPLSMLPALKLQADATTAEFDQRYPQGADYVIVPAVSRPADTTLVAWIAAQGAKGATVVSICDGALVVANAGLFKGRRATGHWATESYRKEHYPDTQWISNTRYVADGKVISSAGVSAAMPTALALVEAFAGRERAEDVARQIGADGWNTEHDSDIFRPRLGTNLSAYITGYTNHWLHSPDNLGVAVAPGVDEITLAYTADAWSRSKRSKVYTVAASAEPLPPVAEATPPNKALDIALAGLAQRYGHNTAKLVALEFEYPSFH